ncbi:MAG TPA: four helix bundle protein [Bacteroidales bacterium]|nr:four helix bundle protein [Bacteroidales bacterium]HRZ48769.1 four helix bundle protein [Bacteroidales bacterium]
MGGSVIKLKSLAFAVRIVKLQKFLIKQHGEYELSRQLLRSGTAVGAMISEAEHAESKADFIHKMAIGQKEINESLYWLELLKETKYLTEDEYFSMYSDAEELLKILTKIIKTAKNKPPQQSLK